MTDHSSSSADASDAGESDAESSPAAGTPDFSGSVPRGYERRLVPLLFEDYADDLARRVGPIAGGAVLETAAGTGVVTRRLRATLPGSSSLTATDFNAGMLEIAQEALAGLPGIEYRQADATALPFEDGSFDAVACQFGVMFFPDEALGYREAARVLRPGGRFLFSVWDDLERNPIAGCLHEVLCGLAPEDPPDFLAVPFRALDVTGMVRDLQAAGFDEVVVSVLARPCCAESAASAVGAYLTGSPLRRQVEERGLLETGGAAAVRAMAERYAGGDEAAAFEVPMQAVVFEARLG
ncbi:MAG: SAM-dependent methyltransferase [Phycisphaerales bacterium]|jgi:SAM-dependent methyltransferase